MGLGVKSCFVAWQQQEQQQEQEHGWFLELFFDTRLKEDGLRGDNTLHHIQFLSPINSTYPNKSLIVTIVILKYSF